jgi:hypothetical protein
LGRGWSAALHTPRRTTAAAPSAPSSATAAGLVLLRPDLLRRSPEKVEALLFQPDLAVTFFIISSSFWLNLLDLVGYICGFTKNFDVILLDLV